MLKNLPFHLSELVLICILTARVHDSSSCRRRLGWDPKEPLLMIEKEECLLMQIL